MVKLIKEELEDLIGADIIEYKNLTVPTIIVCRICKTEHTDIILRSYRLLKNKCCANGKIYTKNAPNPKEVNENGRSPQIDFEKIKHSIELICKYKKGECIDINSYKNSKTPLKMKCNICNTIWGPTYNNMVNKGSWCPTCSTTNDNEVKCRMILEYIFPDKKFNSIRPKWLKYINDRSLELDCYNAELNLALEKNGIQHDKMDPYFHMPQKTLDLSEEEILEKCNENFINQQKRDNFKKEKCIEKRYSFHYYR